MANSPESGSPFIRSKSQIIRSSTLAPGIFSELSQQRASVGGEIQFIEGIAALLRREKVLAYRYEGSRYDCGSPEGFLQANVELALHGPLRGAALASYLRTPDILPSKQTGA